ncbi:hypothetical protein MHB81_23835 [Paenibacillus sp. FSL H7-0326]
MKSKKEWDSYFNKKSKEGLVISKDHALLFFAFITKPHPILATDKTANSRANHREWLRDTAVAISRSIEEIANQADKPLLIIL